MRRRVAPRCPERAPVRGRRRDFPFGEDGIEGVDPAVVGKAAHPQLVARCRTWRRAPFEARLQPQRHQQEWRVVVENVFDRHYALPLGGTYVGQGRTMSINGVPFGIPVPGMGRSINVGVNYKF